MNTFSIDTTCKRAIPRWPYQEIAARILGVSYELSVRFVGATAAKNYNQSYRGKDYVPDVLAFPLDTKIGQIIITPQAVDKKAASFGLSPRQYTGFLFVHACLHLLGHDHGDAMERAEQKYCAQFKITHPSKVRKT